MNTNKITMRVVDITPELAVSWLRFNNGNRPIRRRQLRKLTEDMLAGMWVLNGEAIKFSCNGRLLDGQHRLHAVIKSGVTVQCVVIENVPETDNVFETIDCGALRTPADALRLAKKPHFRAIPAIIRMDSVLKGSDPCRLTNAYITKIAHEEQESLVEACHAANQAKDFVNGAAYGAFYWNALKRSSGSVPEFHCGLVEMTGLSKSSPIIALRKSLQKTGRNGALRDRVSTANRCLYAFNMWESGKLIDRLHIPKTNLFLQAI